jgi:hypothetical protein
MRAKQSNWRTCNKRGSSCYNGSKAVNCKGAKRLTQLTRSKRSWEWLSNGVNKKAKQSNWRTCNKRGSSCYNGSKAVNCKGAKRLTQLTRSKRSWEWLSNGVNKKAISQIEEPATKGEAVVTMVQNQWIAKVQKDQHNSQDQSEVENDWAMEWIRKQ